MKTGLGVGAFRFLLLIIVKIWELKGGKKQIQHVFIKDMFEISLYIDSHLVGKRAKCIFSRRMWMVFGFGLKHTSESSVRAKYTIYLPSFLAAIHYYVAFRLVDILFITKEPLLIPKVSCNAYLSGKVPLWIYTMKSLQKYVLTFNINFFFNPDINCDFVLEVFHIRKYELQLFVLSFKLWLYFLLLCLFTWISAGLIFLMNK